MYVTIAKEIHKGICIVTLRQPEKRNKLDIRCMEELIAVFCEQEEDPACRAIILAAEGEYFCGGGDLGDFRTKNTMEIRKFGEHLKKLFCTITRLSKPVIAAARGHVHGGGFTLLEACDLAVAGFESTFAIPEFAGGLSPVLSLVGVMQTVTRKTAMRMALLSEVLTASEALAAGIVNYVCENEKVLEKAMELALKISSLNPSSVHLCKKLYNSSRDLPYETQLEYGVGILTAMLTTENAKEVLDARDEGRDPVWKRE